MPRFVLVDWRPYDLPSVVGPFETESEATLWALINLDECHLDEDGELPDGIDVRILEEPV